jgi:MSHA pilin protein MshA
LEAIDFRRWGAAPGRRRVRAGAGAEVAGFTLVELVVVITLLSVLAAFAVPRLISLSSEARVASIRSLEGSLRSAAAVWHSACLLKAPCGTTPDFYFLNVNGRSWRIINTYPEAGDIVGGDQIDAMIDSSGFAIDLPSNLITRFRLADANDPTNCQVTYKQAASLGPPPTITSITSGC